MKRNDAKEVFDIPTFKKIFPFMMKRRCDALVYQTLNLDVTKTVEFVRQYNKEHPDEDFRMKFFYVFVAALMRTMAMRPELNRFIANSRYWQRNELSFNFIIKESYSDEAPEYSSPITVQPDMILPEIAKLIDDQINEARKENPDDMTADVIHWFTKLPTWLLNFIVSVAGFMDKKGVAPSVLREVDGLHASAYISNLGSIGLMSGATQHHLYEWGTTSLFVTMGGLNRKISFEEDGSYKKSYEIVVGTTLDERIADGYYFVKSFMYLQELLNNPGLLMERPQLPPPILTKKEYQAKVTALLKAHKLERRMAARQAKEKK